MIMREVLDLMADNISLMVIYLGISVLLAATINYCCLRRFTGGLIQTQIAFVFNTATIGFLFHEHMTSAIRVVHYAVCEGGALAAVYAVYCLIIRHRRVIWARFNQLPMRRITAVAIGFNALLAAIFFYLTPTDGGSRLTFAVTRWYSFLRMLITLIVPLSYFLAVHLVTKRRWVSAGLLTATLIAANFAALSRAGFVFLFAAAALFYRDLNGDAKSVKIGWKTALLLGGGISAAAWAVLSFMNFTFVDISERLVHDAEATIMVYGVPNPHEAAAGVSLFTILHRGVARLCGDSTAVDINTVFGFRLSEIHYGANTLTGPNSSIPAYFLCNLPGFLLLVGLAMIAVYTIVMCSVSRVALRSRMALTVLLVPFVVSSITSFPQDYNSGMSDVTCSILILMGLFMTIRPQPIWHSRRRRMAEASEFQRMGT